MGLRLHQKVWANLIKISPRDGIKEGHAVNLVLVTLEYTLIIYGSLGREVGFCTEIDWILVGFFFKDTSSKLRDQESLEVVRTMSDNE